jgi:transposase
MRKRLSQSPWWVLSITSGTVFGVLTALFDLNKGAQAAVLHGIISGAVFGAIQGPIAARRVRRQRAAVSHLSPVDVKAANRAVMRGPVPTDPRVRQTAFELASRQLRELSKILVFYYALFTVMDVLSVYVVIHSHKGLILPVFFTALLIAPPLVVRHLRRRVQRLQSPTYGH